MIRKITPIILTLLIGLVGETHGAGFNGTVNKGNRAFEEGDYRTALEHYRQAEVERPESPELQYNIGSALYKEGKLEEAAEKLSKALVTENVGGEASAFYNLGNVFYRMEDYQKAIESYQKSLELNPEDMDAKYNLELARRMLKEQLKPESQKDQQQQQQPQNQNQNQQEQQNQKQEQDQEKSQEQQQRPQQQPQQQDENEMSKEDAERILNALKDDEKELQKDVRQMQGSAGYQGKDW